MTIRSGCESSREAYYSATVSQETDFHRSFSPQCGEEACMILTILHFCTFDYNTHFRYFTNMVTYSLFLDDVVVDDNVVVLHEHDDSIIQLNESSFDATDADGDTAMDDLHENLKTLSISDVGNSLTLRPAASPVDFFMSPGSSVEDDESDANSVTSLLGLTFVDDELDVDSLCMSPGSSVDEELAFDSVVSSVSNVEEIMTPSVLFFDGSDKGDDILLYEDEREIGSCANVDVDVFIMADKDGNRTRSISLGCLTVHGLSLILLLTFEQITLPVFVVGFLFMWLSTMMPGMQFGQTDGRPSPAYDVIYLSCPVLLPPHGVKLATIEEEGETGEVDEDEERNLQFSLLVPLRVMKLATIQEEDDGDVLDEEGQDSLSCSILVPLRGVQLYTIEEEVEEEAPQEEQLEQEDNDDSGPNLVDDDEEDDFEEAATPSERTKPTVPLLEFRRSARIAAKAGTKLILPVGTEGSLFVNGKRRSARLSLF